MCIGGRRWTCDVFIIVVMKILLFSRDFFLRKVCVALKNEVDYCSRSPNEEAAFEFFRIEYSAVIMYCFIFLICWKSRVVR